jgi:hypothetical protein
MFAASLDALRIDAAMLPAPSPDTKRGKEPWLLIHAARNVGSLDLYPSPAWRNSVTSAIGVCGATANSRLGE